MDSNDSGQLSLDFLIGFTIFLIGFIIVITMASGLLVGLMSKTIDYDAVAYRTGVILVEDPGYALDPVSINYVTGWELINPIDKEDVLRIGLAVVKNNPNVLSDTKIREFFLTLSDEDIHKKVLFDTPLSQGGSSLFPYHYNITLTSIDSSAYPNLPPRGESAPENANIGYIRRMVKIKQPSYAEFNLTTPEDIPNATAEIVVNFDISKLYGSQTDPIYRIDPLKEPIRINITNITDADMANFTIWKKISFYYDNPPPFPDDTGDTPIELYIPYTTTANSILVDLDARFFSSRNIDPGRAYYFKFFFPGSHIGNNTTFDFDYFYGSSGMFQPELVPAVLEVRIW